MSKQTFEERCLLAEQCLPDAPYRAMLKKLHTEMLAKLAEQSAQQVVDCHATGVCVQSGLWAEPPAQQEPVAWPCLIAEADFSENTVTLAMQCTDYKVSAGKHWLYTSPPAQRTWEEWFKWWRTSKVSDSTEAEIDFADFMLIARAVESEYGIKGNT